MGFDWIEASNTIDVVGDDLCRSYDRGIKDATAQLV